jgi:putative endonuclease
MFWVYILLSKKDGKLYVGCTSDLQDRIRRHNSGYVQATKHRRPLTLIHSEEFIEKVMAFKRERFLKSLWGAREKKKILLRFLAENHEQ